MTNQKWYYVYNFFPYVCLGMLLGRDKPSPTQALLTIWLDLGFISRSMGCTWA